MALSIPYKQLDCQLRGEQSGSTEVYANMSNAIACHPQQKVIG